MYNLIYILNITANITDIIEAVQHLNRLNHSSFFTTILLFNRSDIFLSPP